MNLWLDDVRNPPGEGAWLWVSNVEEAKKVLFSYEIEDVSLDHDLGICEECLVNPSYTGRCVHIGTGYELLCWMELWDIWPKGKIAIHSSNPVGRQKMQQVIDRHYRDEVPPGY